MSQRKALSVEQTKLSEVILNENSAIDRMKRILKLVDDIEAAGKEAARLQDDQLSLKSFGTAFEALLSGHYELEFASLHLDHVVVGAIVPVLKRMMRGWNVMEDSGKTIAMEIRQWRKGLGMKLKGEALELAEDDDFSGRSRPIKK